MSPGSQAVGVCKFLFYQIIATLGVNSYQCGIVVILRMPVMLFLPLQAPPWGNADWLWALVRGHSQQDWELVLHTQHPAHSHLSHPLQITGRHGKAHRGCDRTSRAHVYIQGNHKGTSTIWKWVSVGLFHWIVYGEPLMTAVSQHRGRVQITNRQFPFVAIPQFLLLCVRRICQIYVVSRWGVLGFTPCFPYHLSAYPHSGHRWAFWGVHGV